jgi:PAS domain S-box-containing protein
VVRLIDSDIGRPLSDLASDLCHDQLISDCNRMLNTLAPIEQEVVDTRERWHLARLQPYRTADNIIDGLVMTVVNIDATKRAAQRAQAGIEYFASIVKTVREPLLLLDEPLRVIQANDSFCRAFSLTQNQIVGQLIYELSDGQRDIPELRQLLERILPDKTEMSGFRVEHNFRDLGHRVFMVNARLLPRIEEPDSWIIVAFEDVTPRRS